MARRTFNEGIDAAVLEWERDVELCSSYLQNAPVPGYRAIVEALGGFSAEQRGSGQKCALFALAATWLFRERGPNDALQAVVNVLGSDTDTIGTMLGALLGALYPNEPLPGELQDYAYIEQEAKRLYLVGKNSGATSFTYPDLLVWQPPKTQLDSVGLVGDEVAIAGLGLAREMGAPFVSKKKDSAWQWFMLHFGQSVLCKRRLNLNLLADFHHPGQVAPMKKYEAPEGLISPPGRKENPVQKHDKNHAVGRSGDLFMNHRTLQEPKIVEVTKQAQLPVPEVSSNTSVSGKSISELVDKAIRANFDPRVIGIDLLSFAGEPNGVELSIAYSALIVKARMSRLRKAL